METDKIYLGDCLEVMKDIPEGSIDMICTDLPYEVLHRDNPHAQWDRIIPFEPLWEQYERVIKPNGAILLFAQGLFTAQLIMSNVKLYRYTLVWDKMRCTGFLNANRMPLRCHEDIVVFYKQLPTYNPQMEDLNGREPSHPQGKGTHKDTNQCYGKVKRTYKTGRSYDYDKGIAKVAPTQPDKKFPLSIIRIRKEHETTTYHPTQKPVNLLRYLIRTYTNPGETVLDSCMGSGTTCIAAIKESRHYIGIERDRKYFAVAEKRIKEENQQLKIQFT